MKIGLFTDAYFPIISGVSLSVDTLAKELTKLMQEARTPSEIFQFAAPTYLNVD